MDIAAWLQDLGLEKYEPAFRQNEIDLDVLPELSEADFEKLGLPLGPRKKLLKAIAALREAPRAERQLPAAAATTLQPHTAERRQLTVLFCDLVGSTELSARLDPEDLRQVMGAYQEDCAAVITRFGGHVAKYMGDGVLAYFGWPRAHEDDAERAVRAGLELTEAVGRLRPQDGASLQARVGIATGVVVVGDLLGEGASEEEAVIGETPNLAARLQALAEPGTVVLAPATRRLVGELFALDDLGPCDLKGFARSLRAWRVVGESTDLSRFEALRGTYRTPLVGRERELQELDVARAEALAGRGKMVAAIGEPGVGKSRLFDAFLGAAPLSGWRVLRCGCRSYSESTPWVPVIELVKGFFGIESRDEQERATAKIAKGLARFGASMARATNPICALLDLPVDDPEWRTLNPPQRRRQILDAIKGLLIAESDREAVALLVEDLHWSDSETLALLDGLIESVASHRMLLLVSYRPEFQHTWGGRTCYRQLRVDPLPGESTAQLLAALLGSDPALGDLKRELFARTEGNPLFLEEAVRDLAEREALAGEPGNYQLARATVEIHIPPTVQAILAARIDRLPGEPRQLLQRAAVIGRDVPRALLEAVSRLPGDRLDRQLGELQAAEMLHETRLLPDVEYAFRHALIHDVASAGLLRDVKCGLHRQVGEAIEQLYPERHTELAETLADHFERGEVWSKAARYALDATEKAKSRYAYSVGIRFARLARDAAARDEELSQEWIWANVQLGDLASLVDDLELANESYDQALGRSQDPTEQRWISNKHHRPHFAERDGIRIPYYVHGTGDETLTFVIPMTYGLAVLQPLLERLCQEIRIITIDPVGTTGPVPPEYSLVDHALDVAAVLRAARVPPVTAVGISLGATILAQAAAVEPDLFEKLVMVCAPPGMPNPNTVRSEHMAREMAAIAEGDFEKAMRLLTLSIISEPGTEDLQALRLQTLLRLPKETIVNFYQQRTAEEMAIAPVLQKLRKPSLIMHGTADLRIPVEEARRLATSIHGAQFYPLEGRCHLCMFTATDEFCQVLRDFVHTGKVPRRVEVRDGELR